MMDLTVLKPGSEVTLLEGPLATVICVMIEDGRVSYKIAWLNGQSYEEKWVPEFLLKRPNAGIIKVGFGAK